MVVVVIMAIVLGLAAPRVGRVPSRVQSEYCVSAVRTVLDVASLRARTTGQACRLVLVPSVEAGGGSAGGSPWWAKALSRWGIVNRPSVVSDEDLETCTFVVERADPDPLAQMLSGRAAMTRGTTASETGSGSNAGVYGLAQDQFSLPDAVAWDPDSIRAATGDGARGPAFLFHCSGEAAGPVLEFGVGKRHYRLEVDPLTGRVDIAAVTRR